MSQLLKIKDSANKVASAHKKLTKKAKESVAKTQAEHAGLPSVESKSHEIHLVISQAQPPVAPSAPIKKPRAKRVVSEEQKVVLRERVAKAREAKNAKKSLTT